VLGHKVLDTSAVVITHGTARMLVATCSGCGLPCVPRLLRCSRCHSTRFTARPLDPAGVLYAFSQVAVAPKGWTVPYLVGYVDMRAGVRVFARLAIDTKVARPGMAVELELRPCPGAVGRYYYQFIEAPRADPTPDVDAGIACPQRAESADARQGVST